MLLRLKVNVPAGERTWESPRAPHSTKGSASLIPYPLVHVTLIWKMNILSHTFWTWNSKEECVQKRKMQWCPTSLKESIVLKSYQVYPLKEKISYQACRDLELFTSGRCFNLKNISRALWTYNFFSDAISLIYSHCLNMICHQCQLITGMTNLKWKWKYSAWFIYMLLRIAEIRKKYRVISYSDHNSIESRELWPQFQAELYIGII